MNPNAVWLSFLFMAFFGARTDAAEDHISASKAGARTALRLSPTRVFDAEDGNTHEGWSVLVISNRITAVGPADQITVPAEAQRMELPDTTLLPGLMDVHSHLFLHPYNETLWDDQVLKEPVAYRSLRAAIHARNTLLAGFTLLRDLGTEGAGLSAS